MPINYLKGNTWLNITREERLFCSYLYFDIKNDISYFINQLNNLEPELESFDKKIQLESSKEWDIGFEVCFYRDLLYCYSNKEKPIRVINEKREKVGLSKFPEKRTFDLCLFAENKIIIIEAKAQQGLESEQCAAFKNDVNYIRELFSEINIPEPPETELIVISSSKYLQSPSFKLENGIGKKFIDSNIDFVSGLISWNTISKIPKFSKNKHIYERADNSYKQ
jgi:hypothetical protein